MLAVDTIQNNVNLDDFVIFHLFFAIFCYFFWILPYRCPRIEFYHILMEGGIISKFKLNVRKVDSDEEDSNFECYDRSEKKPVHADFDKELTEGNKPTLAMLPKKSEEDEIINSGETRDRDGNMNLRRSN